MQRPNPLFTNLIVLSLSILMAGCSSVASGGTETLSLDTENKEIVSGEIHHPGETDFLSDKHYGLSDEEVDRLNEIIAEGVEIHKTDVPDNYEYQIFAYNADGEVVVEFGATDDGLVYTESGEVSDAELIEFLEPIIEMTK